MVAGRTFLPTERGEPKVVIINRAFARMFLGKRAPVGTVFLWGRDGKTPYEIVGVVEGTKNLTLGEGDKAQFYEPLVEHGTRVEFVLRSALPPALQLAAVRQALHRLDPAVGAEVQTMYAAIGLAFPSRATSVIVPVPSTV